MSQPDFTNLIRNPPTRTRRRSTILIMVLYAVSTVVFGVLTIRAGHGLGWFWIGGGIVMIGGCGIDYLLDHRRRRRATIQGPPVRQ